MIIQGITIDLGHQTKIPKMTKCNFKKYNQAYSAFKAIAEIGEKYFDSRDRSAPLGNSLEEEFKSNFKFEIYFYGGNLNFASEEYRNKLEELLSSCDDTLKKKLFFKGEYTHEQLPSIFNNIDCVITPSTWFEVFGLVVSEAWMFEKPVIASDIGGLGDRIQNGENGLKFNPNDAYDLAIKMDEYITHYHFGDREFTNIQPPLSQNDFWQAHKTLFSKFS